MVLALNSGAQGAQGRIQPKLKERGSQQRGRPMYNKARKGFLVSYMRKFIAFVLNDNLICMFASPSGGNS